MPLSPSTVTPVGAIPFLPPGRTAILTGRGEVFYRRHVHPDPTAPTVLLLHGWTASADLQFFTLYEALADVASFVAIDHRGHGRGLRLPQPYQLEDAAADAVGLIDHLGLGPVVALGYSMGGPIALLCAQARPDLVGAIVVQATALEWRKTRRERWRWKALRAFGPVMRSSIFSRAIRGGLARHYRDTHPIQPYLAWLQGELRRNDVVSMVQAGLALGRYDATEWAGAIGKPSAMVVTTEDRLVSPRKQRALAKVLGAHVVELKADHLAPLDVPDAFCAATLAALSRVTALARPVSQPA